MKKYVGGVGGRGGKHVKLKITGPKRCNGIQDIPSTMM